MRILALDHGQARCGVAISDPTGTIVRPLTVVEKPDAEAGRKRIAELAAEYQAELVLIGLPRLAGGDEGAQAAAARSFAGRLGGELDVPIELYDERFTTRLAQRSIAEGASGDKDSLAAAHLLEEYLQTRPSNAND